MFLLLNNIFSEYTNRKDLKQFFNSNPEYAIEYKPFRHVRRELILRNSLQSNRLSVILDGSGCPTCLRKETRLLSEYWSSIGHSTQVFVVGRLPNSLDSSSLRFPHRKLPRDSVFVDSFSSNPLFLLHDGSDIHSVRLADPTQYGYFSRDGEYYKLVSNILAPQAN